MKAMKNTKKQRKQDVHRSLGRLAVALLHVLHDLHGETGIDVVSVPSRLRRPW